MTGILNNDLPPEDDDRRDWPGATYKVASELSEEQMREYVTARRSA